MTTHSAIERPPASVDRSHGAPAGVVTRSCAAGVDLVVVIAATFVAYLLLSGAVFLWRPMAFSFPKISRGLLIPVAAAGFVGYLTVAWALTGRSVGNAVMGLRVLRRDRTRLTLVHSAVRALLYAVLPIGLLACAAGGRRLSLQDLILRTSVVYDWRESDTSSATLVRTSTGDRPHRRR